MRLFVIALHTDPSTKNITGFRLIDADTGDIRDTDIDKIANILIGKIAPIYPLKITKNRSIKSQFGFDNITELSGGKLVGKAKYTLINLYTDGDKLIRADVINHLGAKNTVDIKDTTELIKYKAIHNAKLDSNNKIIIPDGVKLTHLDLEKEQVKKEIKKKEEKEYAEEIKRERSKDVKTNKISPNLYPKLVFKQKLTPEILHEVDENTGMTIEQKIAAVKMQLRILQPFYNSILNVLSLEAGSTKTMGVSLDTLYFNPEFIKEIPIAQLLFVFIHEVLHIAMKHNARQIGRDHTCWNCACDYYINKVISEEFKIKEDNVRYNAVAALNNSHINNHKIFIERPEWVLYTDNINIEKDTPEKIYLELTEIQKSNNSENQDNSGDPNADENSQGNGQGNKDGNQGSSGKNDDGQGNKDASQGNDQENKDGNQGNSSKNNEASQDKNSNAGPGDNNNEGDQSNQNKDNGLTGKTFRGTIIKDLNSLDDLVTDERAKALSEDAANQLANRMLTRAVAHFRQSTNRSPSSNNTVERMVLMELAPKVDWRGILKNKLTAATQKINTFSAPDKRFRSRNMIMPGPKNLEPDSLENIKVCIDTSGSIGDKELGEALTQIKQLLNTYKASASLLYWDTEVHCEVPFKTIKEVLEIKPLGGGGTDANCIFEYFEDNIDYKRRKKKPPSIIIIFTDGYIGEVEGKYKKYKDTIWVVHSNDNFEKPFGSMAKFKN